MYKYIIKGGKPLHGEVEISGAKNAAVAIIPAAMLVDGVCRIENLPQISDTEKLLRILELMGAQVRYVSPGTVDIDCSGVSLSDRIFRYTRSIRASYYLIGSMLGRFGKARTTMPGGCNFGVRPIDQHIKGMKALGATIDIGKGLIQAESPEGRLKGARIYLDKVSVGATINVMIAAATAKGMTIIENVAREPHIVDLANFLNSMGADIRGAGTDVIKVRGVERLHGGSYSLIPDQIEAGTFMTAVAAAGGEVRLNNVIPRHLECISAKLREMGVAITEGDDYIVVRRDRPLERTNVKTLPYPGFPTDMQPQICVVLCLAAGTSVITEGVWDNRYQYVNELKKMGAEITVSGKTAVVEGVRSLMGAPVAARDLRAGAAMVVAGLCAEGTTVIEDVIYIERGYQNIVGKLRALGADIAAVSEPDEPGRMHQSSQESAC
ncbi:MAG: UDP-N-acetylglucosamine 1-carboxyvinyltransferase [Oscillospiraceae bacterium]|nr:UDP-N-acetylglucosamine 1-carboxyvinyltransferase [Oscillospiraceae bacterium]MBR3083699.1 UDP-N-acetylglucosamine 1-carboxyvinyltransferase [Oscillospiraceae bacterium]MBR3860385.1 UDP-N-acetylglucosamine 1-carboxyvinyltransferase [Oscillospiraceae bacterium]MBR7057000.1 UDP-N-acetylglucosamine 1-carboxyvinyltransferase [Oscillospiraceae bacterium]